MVAKKEGMKGKVLGEADCAGMECRLIAPHRSVKQIEMAHSEEWLTVFSYFVVCNILKASHGSWHNRIIIT